jgi:pantoate--beta-alanine ligase
MKILTTRTSLSAHLQQVRQMGQTIALVPTMGALHAGHISLVTRARQLADVIVCSIFVNPTQFNDPADLAAYPRPVENDIALLEEAGCDILFLPAVTEIYQTGEKWHLELDGLDTVLEGAMRPGHYQGVTRMWPSSDRKIISNTW